MTCFIFRELAYWTYKMCSRNRFLVKDKMVTWVAVMWSSIPLWYNVLVVEHLFSYYVLKTDLMEMLPLKSRYDPLSLIITFLLVSPLLGSTIRVIYDLRSWQSLNRNTRLWARCGE